MSLKKRTPERVSAWLVPILMLAIWEIVVRLQLIPPSQAAPPSEAFIRLVTLFFSGILAKHTLYSLARLVIGVLLGSLAGIIASIYLTNSIRADRLFSPTVQLLAGVPVVLWMPFCVMVFGTGETYKISLAAISTFFLVHTLTFQAIRSTQKDYIELADIYEKTYQERVRHILLPSAAPTVFTSIRAALAAGWIILFFVEYATSMEGREGLGWFIADSRSVGRIEEEFAGLFLLALVAFFTDGRIAAFQKRKLKWSKSIEASRVEESF